VAFSKIKRVPSQAATSPRISQVRAGYAFAVKAHGTQKYGTQPYSLHLRDVMRALQDLGFADEQRLTIAALHDVLEDTNVPKADLARQFGPTIANAVDELSRKKVVATEDYIGEMGELAFAVKLADRLANLRHNGRPMDRADLDHQTAKTFPKYQREQALLEAHARTFGPEFADAIQRIRTELNDAGTRLSLCTARSTFNR
jgi:(p)ppGpp synthase/HD superfamily hydrolase